MSEATVNQKVIESQEMEGEEGNEKTYTFRKLSSKDVFLMFSIVSKIGINEFAKCMNSKSVLDAIKGMAEEGTGEEKDSVEIVAAGAVILEALNVVLGNIGKCEKEIYTLLANTSNMSEKEIMAEGNAVLFVEMVVDFLKKEEFPDFFKAVARLFK